MNLSTNPPERGIFSQILNTCLSERRIIQSAGKGIGALGRVPPLPPNLTFAELLPGCPSLPASAPPGGPGASPAQSVSQNSRGPGGPWPGAVIWTGGTWPGRYPPVPLGPRRDP